MTEAEIVLVKEGLQFANDALARLQQVDNSSVKHVANILHGAVVFGETVLSVFEKL